jgi:transposase
LTTRRRDLVAARTQTLNRLHRLLLELVCGGTRRNLIAKRAAGLLAAATPTGRPAVIRWQPATELVTEVRQLEQRIAAAEGPIKAAVAQANTSLLALFGVGPVLAARSATSVGSPASIISPPTPAPPPWRPPAARSSATGCPGPGTASSTTPYI